MTIILGNAFSLNMLSADDATVSVRKSTLEDVRDGLAGGFISAIGHESTAAFLAAKLATDVAFNRINIILEPGTILFVAQPHGRLEEGKILSHEEISAFPMAYWRVEVL